jgi:hypothetical protein
VEGSSEGVVDGVVEGVEGVAGINCPGVAEKGSNGSVVGLVGLDTKLEFPGAVSESSGMGTITNNWEVSLAASKESCRGGTPVA